MAGHFKRLPLSQHYSDHPQFSGFMKPCRYEGEVQNLEVYGEIPKEIDGTFYRVMPDPAFPPFIDNDPVNALPPACSASVTDYEIVVQWRWLCQCLPL
jgi:carotenoid cleavage dioxygenase